MQPARLWLLFLHLLQNHQVYHWCHQQGLPQYQEVPPAFFLPLSVLFFALRCFLFFRYFFVVQRFPVPDVCFCFLFSLPVSVRPGFHAPAFSPADSALIQAGFPRCQLPALPASLKKPPHRLRFPVQKSFLLPLESAPVFPAVRPEGVQMPPLLPQSGHPDLLLCQFQLPVRFPVPCPLLLSVLYLPVSAPVRAVLLILLPSDSSFPVHPLKTCASMYVNPSNPPRLSAGTSAPESA